MLITISCIVISITAFSVTKKLMKNWKEKKTKLNCGNTTMVVLFDLSKCTRGFELA
jgi:hypothetical protein